MHCPNCLGTKIERNGNTHYGKQNYKCKSCSRQFVEGGSSHFISASTRESIRRSLCERVSLRGICRIFKVSMSWLLGFAVQVWQETPDDLAASLERLEGKGAASLECIGFEIDECWSFVQNKEDKAWVWVVYDFAGKQVIAFEVGKRDQETFEKLWSRIPQKYRAFCDFISDDYVVYKGIIPEEQHYISKTLSQRVENCSIPYANVVADWSEKHYFFLKAGITIDSQ